MCGKCLIKTSGKISPMSNNERRLLGDKAQEGWRLACMTRIHGNITLYLDKPASEDSSSSSELLKVAFPTVAPSEQPGTASGETLGFAIDAGTATLAVYLYSLDEERLIGWSSISNPQSKYGSDTVARIQYAGSRPGAQTRMRRAVLSALDACMGRLLEQYSGRPKQVNYCRQYLHAAYNSKCRYYSAGQRTFSAFDKRRPAVYRQKSRIKIRSRCDSRTPRRYFRLERRGYGRINTYLRAV